MFTTELVKHHQPTLFAALDALPWVQVPIAARDLDTGHGRITTRTIQVLPAPADLPFPHTNQVWLLERYTTDPTGTPLSAVAALGVTNLPTDRLSSECLATLIRQHWGIESLHWLRDTLYREDNSTATPNPVPQPVKIILQIGLELLDGLPIDSGGTLVLLDAYVCLPHQPLRYLKRFVFRT